VKVGCSSANGNRKRITSAWLSRSVDHMVGPWRIDCVMERGSFAYEAFSKKPLLAETNDVRRRAQVGTEVQTAPLWSRFRLHLFILSHLTDRLTDYFCFVQLLMPMRSPLICCLRGKRCKTFTLCIIVLRAICCVCLPGEITIIIPINYEPKRLTHSAWAKEIAAIK